jgi:hypothetical protein
MGVNTLVGLTMGTFTNSNSLCDVIGKSVYCDHRSFSLLTEDIAGHVIFLLGIFFDVNMLRILRDMARRSAEMDSRETEHTMGTL